LALLGYYVSAGQCSAAPETVLIPAETMLDMGFTHFLPRFLHSFLSSSLGLISVLMRFDSIRAFRKYPAFDPHIWTESTLV